MRRVDKRAPGRERLARMLVAGAAVLVLASPALPLWSCTFRARQYPDEPLTVTLYASRLTGDLDEIGRLNQYIGVRIPKELPELAILRPLLVTLSIVLAAAALAPRRVARASRWTASALLVAAMTGVLAMGQWRLHEVGHHRAAHAPIAGFKDFTPPVLGPATIGNFNALALPACGGWLLAAAIVSTGAGAWIGRRRRRFA
jgi:hypothetical protein